MVHSLVLCIFVVHQSHQKRTYMMSVMRNKAPAATLAYVDLVFRYLASLLYFLERLVRLLALVSRAV